MLSIVFIFKSLFVVMAIVFSGAFINDLKKNKFKHEKANIFVSGAIGGISYFFNALGIGSFATSTAMLRFFKQIEDKNLPGTLNVTCVLPELLAAFIFISIVKVDPITITCMVVATCIGAWLGASIVHRMSEKVVCFVMSIALFLAGSLLCLKEFNLIPTDYSGAIGLDGIKLIVATVGSVCIGVLSAMGIGTYAPFLALSLTLGLGARAVFPIMMSATALGGGFAGIKFIKNGNYDRKATLAMVVVSVFGVMLAAYVVKSLPLYILTWVVIGVIYYTSISLFMKGYKLKKYEKEKLEQTAG